MPYVMRKIRNENKYKVINSKTGFVHAKSTTKDKAVKQINLLNRVAP
jgi:hypothetical protein